jgi:hypothetical protein
MSDHGNLAQLQPAVAILRTIIDEPGYSIDHA